MTINSGLSFKQIDLHVHTPASADFIGSTTPEELISKAIGKQLSAIAITDHNSGDWIDRVKLAASSTTLVVFPGVELTCSGGERNIHVLAFFDIERDTEYVNSFLASIGVLPENRGKEDVLINLTVTEIIDLVQNKWGGIAVLAHVNSTSGVLNEIKGQQRITIVKHPTLMAVEATDFQNVEKQARKKRAVDLLDGTDPEYKRKLAVYQGSDNPGQNGGHSVDGIGIRTSFFKMETINLDSLYQCFADSDVRIRQDFEFSTETFPRIKEMYVSGGFLGGQSIPFHEGLNSILGGKGTGKSLIIELLRFGLNQPPTQPELVRDHEGKLNQRLGNFEHVEIQCEDENGNPVKIKRFRDSFRDHPYDNIQYDPAQVFPVLFLSQNEIIRIAEQEIEQLKFIDRFFDFRAYKSRIANLENDLLALDKRMAESLYAIPLAANLREQITTLQQEIAIIDQALKHPIFEKYKSLVQKERNFQSQAEYASDLTRTVDSHVSKVKESEPPTIEPELQADAALKRNLEILKAVRETINLQLAGITTASGQAREEIEKEIEQWQPVFERGKAEYDQHIQASGGDTKVLAAEREQKSRNLDGLSKRLQIERKKIDDLREIQTNRDKLLDKLEEIYKQYFEERKEKTAKFQSDSAGRLRLSIIEGSNVGEFKSRLSTLKRGSYLKDIEIEVICEKVKPRDFILALLRFAALEGKNAKPLDEVSKLSGIALDRMQTLAGHLIQEIPYEELLSLQYKATPEDRPELLYNVGGNDFRPLAEVSVGQKSIALLIMALSDGTMPVVIDQPEDSLDIRSIWEDVCLKLRLGKHKRQFISTTHSSSVAVSSDSDKFIVLDGDANKASVVYAGSMDSNPVSDEVMKYLEGGLESYKRKHLKYRAERRLSNESN